MAVNFFIGQNGKARRVRQQFVSVNGKARRVLKGYVGVNGKARLFYSATTECVEHKEAPALSYTSTEYLSAASTPDYAIFAGGLDSRSAFSEVMSARAYSRSLTIQSISSLSVEKGHGTSLSFNGRAVFAGGYKGVFMGYKHNDYVDTYDNSLTKSSLSRMRDTKASLAGTVVGNYMIFAGGETGSQINNQHMSSADAYDTSFTKISVSSLSVGRGYLRAATVGKYAIFAGGYSKSGYHSTVDVYDSSLTKTTGAALSEIKDNMAPGSNESYAIFVGGYNPTNINNVSVDIYNKSLTHTTTPRVLIGTNPASASVDGNIIVTGGYINDVNSGTKGASNGFYVYDGSLTVTTPYQLTHKRGSHAMTCLGDYVLVGGGSDNGPVTSVEYFKFA